MCHSSCKSEASLSATLVIMKRTIRRHSTVGTLTRTYFLVADLIMLCLIGLLSNAAVTGNNSL